MPDTPPMNAETAAELAALDRSLATISFAIDGVILRANANFLALFDYDADDVIGRHHRLFVPPEEAAGAGYAAFWDGLRRGRFQSGEFRRLAKDGREVWIQATYNPVFGPDGTLVKIVKYATDVTAEKLRRADDAGQIVAINKSQLVIHFALDGTVLDANELFLDAMGYRLDEVKGRRYEMFLEPGVAADVDYSDFWETLRAGRHHAAVYKRLAKGGREVWLQATYSPVFGPDGTLAKIVTYATDVTAEKLRRADDAGQIVAINKSQLVVHFALDGTVLDANELFLDAMGYRLDEVRGRRHDMFLEPGVAASADYAAFWESLRAGRHHAAMYKRLAKGGREVWIQASYNPIFDLNGQPFKVVKYATDVTSNVALAEAFRDAERKAQHDPTTALPNRLRLASFLTEALAQNGASVAVLCLDLDRFKPINDAFGHHVGDRVLSETANRLRRCLTADQLAARVGGDEFVVVAPGLAEEEIAALCERLISSVSAPMRHDGVEVAVGLSIGAAVSPADGMTADGLLRRADDALYRSKAAGRGTYSFAATGRDDQARTPRWRKADMRCSLAADDLRQPISEQAVGEPIARDGAMSLEAVVLELKFLTRKISTIIYVTKPRYRRMFPS